MSTLAGCLYREIGFTHAGGVREPAAVDALLTTLVAAQATDLLVLVHGWNNDCDEARDLYRNLVPLLAAEAQKVTALTNRTVAVLGVLWPAKKFTDDQLSAGGAASLNAVPDSDALVARLKSLDGFFDGAAAQAVLQLAIAEAPKLTHDPNAPARFVALLQTLMAPTLNARNHEPEDAAARQLATQNPVDLLIRLSDVDRVGAAGSPTGGGAAATDQSAFTQGTVMGESGGAGGLFDSGGLLNGARHLLNFTTYYQMKERAGQVGAQGLYPVLARVKAILPTCRLHLIGHSFGARLVTAATAGPTDASVLPVATLTLLQGAFSHYGFARRFENGRDGLFRSVITRQKVTGPILISQTHNDTAVGVAYAVVSRIAGQVGAFMGDATDRYGGIGANGAQKTPEVSTQFTLTVGADYAFRPGTLYNLNADTTIRDHSDICHPQVARAIISAISVGG